MLPGGAHPSGSVPVMTRNFTTKPRPPTSHPRAEASSVPSTPQVREGLTLQEWAVRSGQAVIRFVRPRPDCRAATTEADAVT